PDLTFSVSAYEPAITSQGTPPQGKYAFALPLASADGVFLNHRPVGPDEFGIVWPNQEYYVFRPARFACAMFLPDSALVGRRCPAMFGGSLREIRRGAPTLHATRGAAAIFARHIEELSAAAVADTKPLGDWAASRGGSSALATELVDELL